MRYRLVVFFCAESTSKAPLTSFLIRCLRFEPPLKNSLEFCEFFNETAAVEPEPSLKNKLDFSKVSRDFKLAGSSEQELLHPTPARGGSLIGSFRVTCSGCAPFFPGVGEAPSAGMSGEIQGQSSLNQARRNQQG